MSNPVKAKDALVRNQAFLDKVVRENERLILLIGTLRNRLTVSKKALTNSRAEALRTLEPQVQQLLADHCENLQRQSRDYESKLNPGALQVELHVMEAESNAETSRVMSDCRSTLHRMKAEALAKEQEMKRDLSRKLGEVPQLVLTECQLFKETLQKEREIWQENRGMELRKAFQEKIQEKKERSERKQLQVLKEMENELNEEARGQNKPLRDDLSRIEAANRHSEKELQAQILQIEQECLSTRDQIDAKLRELRLLKNKAGKCQCDKLEKEVEEARARLDMIKISLTYRQDAHKAEQLGFLEEEAEMKRAIESVKVTNADLRLGVERLKQELEIEVNGAERRISEIEEGHKRELEMISARIRQTIAKKEEMIQQLMARLKTLGNSV
jgi:hypothetical protein